MAGFRRVFTAFPGFDKLGNIESVNVIDVPPPANPLGPGTGVVAIVAEFERGPLLAPTEIFGGADLEQTFGSFGFTKGGVPYSYPVAAKSAGAAGVWEGSGFIHLYRKKFSGLVIIRVDNSAGTVTFRRLASVKGGAGAWDLEPGQLVRFSIDGGPGLDAVFNAAAALITGSGGTYPTGFVGGETLEFKVDGRPAKVVTFTDQDQSVAQVFARVNSQMAMTIAGQSGGELTLSSFIRGWSGKIEVTGGTARATLGLPLAPVAKVYTWTVGGAAVAGTYTIRLTRTINGVSTNYDGSFVAAGGELAAVVQAALLSDLQSKGAPGISVTGTSPNIVATGDLNVSFTASIVNNPGGILSIAPTNVGTFTLAEGTGNVANIDRTQRAEAIAIINLLAGLKADSDPDNLLRVANTATPGTGTIKVLLATADLGFPVGVLESAIPTSAAVIPAGTIVQDSANDTKWLTLEDVQVAANSSSSVDAKVRPAVDDDSAPTSAATNVSILVDTLDGCYTVSNSAQIARLNSFQMDSRYEQAVEKTLNVSGVPFAINQIYSARTSDVINAALSKNAVLATQSGHRARKAAVGQVVGTSRTDAKTAAATTSSERTFFVFPGFKIRVSEIALLGVEGGTGFTEDGVIQIPAHGFYASVRSILNPEENAGQQLSDTNYGDLPVLALEDLYDPESGLPNSVNLQIEDYIDFKAKGIIAPRLDRTAGMIFQSDVTSVNPATNPALVDAKRRFMGDFIIDGLTDIGVKYVKKLNTPYRRRSYLATVNNFLNGLKSSSQPESSRISDFSVTDETTEALRQQGFQITNVRVQLYASMDFIVFKTEVGTTVNVKQVNA